MQKRDVILLGVVGTFVAVIGGLVLFFKEDLLNYFAKRWIVSIKKKGL